MQYLHEGEKILGLSIPVSALKTKESCGVGEFLDLVALAQFCTLANIDLIQLLPVNDTGLQSSPYSALSAFALNPLFCRPLAIDASAATVDLVKAFLKKLPQGERFVYYKLYTEKMAVFKQIFQAQLSQILKDWQDESSALRKWASKQDWLIPYAVFFVLKEKNEYRHWKDWPKAEAGNPEAIQDRWQTAELKEEHLFPIWLQYHSFRQFSDAALAVRELGIDLKGDIPILMNEDSCDVWSRKELFNFASTAGAPPDMFSHEGQNWKFPTYSWDAHHKEQYAWWKARLKLVDSWYSAFRIDHVLGFFRIWACASSDESAILGWYQPGITIAEKSLMEQGFSKERLTWLSQPHIYGSSIEHCARSIQDGGRANNDIEVIKKDILIQLPGEDLWLFSPSIKGEQDLYGKNLSPEFTRFLIEKWRDRCLLPAHIHGGEGLTPSWYWKDSSAWKTLSDEEQLALEDLAEAADLKAAAIWEKQGYKLLKELAGSVEMLACAEDLGAVPACVPKTLKKLHIFGLRVVRWYRDWEKEGNPYIPLSRYGKESVCTPAVHDSSTLRDWWENEAEQEVFAKFLKRKLPSSWSPAVAKTVLESLAGASSNIFVVQLQDLLHLDAAFYSPHPKDERINIPGTVNDFNWTWRIPQTIESLQKEVQLIKGIQAVSAKRKGKKTR